MMGYDMESPIGQEMQQRRTTLKLSMRAAAAAGGVSPTTWSDLESGVRSEPSPATQQAVAKALDWRIDWLDRILAGGEPEVIDPASQPDDELRRRIESLERELTNQTAALAALAHGVAENRAKANNAAAAMLDRLNRLEQTAGL